MLSFILLFCFVGCDDKDYSSDIDALKKELEETKAAVKTIQDLSNALQNQLFINSYEKTDNGYTLKWEHYICHPRAKRRKWYKWKRWRGWNRCSYHN